MKAYFLSLCLLIFSSDAPVLAQKLLDKSRWKLIFNEEFNTTIDDIQQRWEIKTEPHPWDSFYHKSINRKENFQLDKGCGLFYTYKLQTPVVADGQSYFYTTAELLSKYDDVPFCKDVNDAGYLYGMFEIKCRLPAKSGQTTAYWLYSSKMWPPEIDVFEYNASTHNQFMSTLHWTANQQHRYEGSVYDLPYALSADFHVWTVVWTPYVISWFFDGCEIKTETDKNRLPGGHTTNMWERCHWQKMNQQIGSILNWPHQDESSFTPLMVDYIRVYKPIGDTAYHGGGFEFWHDSLIAPLYANTSFTTTRAIEEMQIFPNPCKEVLQVQLPQQWLQGSPKLEVTDMQGRMLKQLVADNEFTTIETDLLPPGMYILKCTHHAAIIYRKFLRK